MTVANLFAKLKKKKFWYKNIVEWSQQVDKYWESKWGKLLRNCRFDKNWINIQQFSSNKNIVSWENYIYKLKNFKLKRKLFEFKFVADCS